MFEQYLSYEQTTSTLGVDKLTERRTKLCLNLAIRAEKHIKYSNWFHPAEEYVPISIKTRKNENAQTLTKYTPVPYRSH